MYAYVKYMLFLAWAEHTSVISPVSETQDYDY